MFHGFLQQQTQLNFPNDLVNFFMAKAKTNQLQRVDIRGMDIGENTCGMRVSVGNYSTFLDVTTTPCNYGKARYWFVCPYCKGRKAVLYLGGSGLACRKCYRLSYSIENKTRSDRAIDGAFKINDRLKFEGAIDCLGDKPKGMHWKTFNRLLEKRDDYSAICWGYIGLYLNRRFGLNV